VTFLIRATGSKPALLGALTEVPFGVDTLLVSGAVGRLEVEKNAGDDVVVMTVLRMIGVVADCSSD
jgi:hypothetical protein